MINASVIRSIPTVSTKKTNDIAEKGDEFWLNKKVFGTAEHDEFKKMLLLKPWDEVKNIIARRMNYLMENDGIPKQFSTQEYEMHIIRGFISPDYRITYHYPYFYRVLSTDYIYHAVEDFRGYSQNVRYKFGPVTFIGWFLNDYLGRRGSRSERDEIFLKKAEEVFEEAKKNGKDPNEAMNRIDIELLRKNHVCLCSERSVYAQNIVAFFGLDSYICLGNIEIKNCETNETIDEVHCFNLFSGTKIVDFSFYDEFSFRNRISRTPAAKELNSSKDSFLRGRKSEDLTTHRFDLSVPLEKGKIKQKINYRVLSE